jgi:Holliday junction resolvase RusA-like endonuclease
VTHVSFTVHGDPKAQPRPRAFARKMGNKYVARVFESGTAEGWKSLIAAAAKPHKPPVAILGPVRVDLTFVFPRPKSHFRTGKNAGVLRDDAPTWHTSKPDRDNLEKAVLDSLTQLGGFWRDDSQVCAGGVQKYYGIEPGVGVRITEMEVGK